MKTALKNMTLPATRVVSAPLFLEAEVGLGTVLRAVLLAFWLPPVPAGVTVAFSKRMWGELLAVGYADVVLTLKTTEDDVELAELELSTLELDVLKLEELKLELLELLELLEVEVEDSDEELVVEAFEVVEVELGVDEVVLVEEGFDEVDELVGD